MLACLKRIEILYALCRAPNPAGGSVSNRTRRITTHRNNRSAREIENNHVFRHAPKTSLRLPNLARRLNLALRSAKMIHTPQRMKPTSSSYPYSHSMVAGGLLLIS
jgi:hypothetical protein